MAIGNPPFSYMIFPAINLPFIEDAPLPRLKIPAETIYSGFSISVAMVKIPIF